MPGFLSMPANKGQIVVTLDADFHAPVGAFRVLALIG